MTSEIESTLFILPKHAFNWAQLVDDGLTVHPPYKGRNNFFLRVLREIHFRMNLPKKSIWFCDVPQQYKTFFIFADLIIPEYIEWLHNQYPDSKYIMFYMNNCTEATNPEKFRFDYLKLWSGDVNDCQRYGLNVAPKILAYSRNWIVKKESPIYDIFFVGRDKEGKRLSQMLSLESQFKELGLKTYFHMVAEHRYDRYRNRHYKDLMPYQEVLSYLGKSKSILYLGYGSQECVTLRVQESLIHKIKLVTDCGWIKKYDFYNPNNIFILGEDKIESLPEFLNTPYQEVKTEMLKHIYFDDLLEEVVRLS